MIDQQGKNEVAVLTVIAGVGYIALPEPWNLRFVLALVGARIVIMFIRVIGARLSRRRTPR